MAAFTFLWPERSSPSAAPQEPGDGGGVETGRGGGAVGRMIYHPGGRRGKDRQMMDVYCGGVTIEALSATFGF